MNVINRAQKLVLLQSLMNGTATDAHLKMLRQLRETVYVTLNLDDDRQDTPEDLLVQERKATSEDLDEATYHIECFSDGTTRKYYRQPDGSVVPA